MPCHEEKKLCGSLQGRVWQNGLPKWCQYFLNVILQVNFHFYWDSYKGDVSPARHFANNSNPKNKLLKKTFFEDSSVQFMLYLWEGKSNYLVDSTKSNEVEYVGHC